MIFVRDMLLCSWMFSLLKFHKTSQPSQHHVFLYGFRILGTLGVLSELMTGFLLAVHVLTTKPKTALEAMQKCKSEQKGH